jgi:archaellum component FlaC
MKEFTQPSGKFSLADNLRDLCERFELLSIHQGQQDRQIAALQNELKIHGAVHNYAEKDTIERLCNRAKNLENRFANLEAPFTGIATDIDEICKKLDALALRLFNIEAEIRDMKAEDITKIADGDVPKRDTEGLGFHIAELRRDVDALLAYRKIDYETVTEVLRRLESFEKLTKPAAPETEMPTEPETFDFMTAVKHMKVGRKVRKITWPTSMWCSMVRDSVRWNGRDEFPARREYIEATDWTLADDAK